MARRIYYLCKSVAGCMGAESSNERLPETYTSLRRAEQAQKRLSKAGPTNAVYSIGFLWNEKGTEPETGLRSGKIRLPLA